VVFFVTTLTSYGLNANDLPPSVGLPRVFRSNFVTGGDFAFVAMLMPFELFSKGEISGFVGESAPI